MEGHVPDPPIEPIDTRHLGLERVICCFRVGDVLVDPGPELALPHWLDALTAGGWRPRALLLTHIHLDHAGGTGALVRRWPDLDVYVHERGAPHVIDPSKLLASAGRLYGGDAGMARLWGEILPVPAERVRALAGGETIAAGEERFRVAYTPGHASHHVCYLHEGSGRAFVGDTGGVRIPPSDVTIAPTPPPDIDVEAWERSLDAIAAWRPASLGLTHFGAVDEVDAQLDAVRGSLHELAALARDADAAAVTAAVRERATGAGDEVVRKAYAAAVSPEHVHQGLERYWRKRAERATGVQQA